MTHIEKVKNLESELISIVKTSYDNLKLSEGDAIEFTNPFHIYLTQNDFDGLIKVPVVVSGMMDNYILVGVSEGNEVEIGVDILESIYELAYIADNIKSGEFSILVN
jgi:hypothetical protein